MQTVSASFYEFIFLIVGVAGFEPTTPCSQSRCANRTALHPEKLLTELPLFCSRGSGIRTHDPLLPKQVR